MPSASNSAGRLPSGLGFLAPEKVDGILALIGGFCLHLTLGTLYCFGNLNTYMTSYLRKHVHPGIEYSDMIWVPCLATVSQVSLIISQWVESIFDEAFLILVNLYSTNYFFNLHIILVWNLLMLLLFYENAGPWMLLYWQRSKKTALMNLFMIWFCYFRVSLWHTVDTWRSLLAFVGPLFQGLPLWA